MKTVAKQGTSTDRSSWAARAKAVRDDPEARFRFACGHLPRKQAFREAALALRGLIRQHCDDRDAVEQYLALLYRFATLQSLVYSRSSDHADGGRVPDHSLLDRWERMGGVDVPYPEVGTEHLPLLTKTDRKLMEQLWGTPTAQATPRAWLEGSGADPEGVVAVAKLLRGDGATAELPAETALRRRKGDPKRGLSAPEPDVAVLMADEAQEAEDAIFGLMERRRTASDDRKRGAKRVTGWAVGVLDRLGL